MIPYRWPDPDRAYANGDFIPDAAAHVQRWEAQSRAFRASQPNARLDQPYGPGPRQRYDLFLPEGPARGTLVFVHGGYWLAFGPQDWSHLAAGPLAQGWAVALPGYTLAPQARIAAMVAEIAQACRQLADALPGPLHVTGHSAGGHLAARMGCADLDLPVTRIVPISPLAELGPLMATQMNATLGIDAAEAAAQSPARLALRPGCSAHVWVGAQERPDFLWQARTLAEEWACPWTVAPERHHFDVIDALADPGSDLVRTLLAP
ncbi:alpha/beta hydrolase [Xinfangfangia pollutisoli]|uniref:alpha/beta hydrolase n=1 Tax=Xinfangfangia pollutisoli TaxID=2865960 RepID=UPI001CD19998|nr:alpha/beta hydrolase [Xinfangfangia pollutisoli]